MTEKNTDAEGQVVEGQVVDAQVTAEQGVEGQVAVDAESPAGVQQAQDEKQVPYARFKEVNDAKKAAEDAQGLAEQQLREERDRMTLLQANQAPVQPQKVVSNYEQALKDCGVLEEEYLSREQNIQVNARKEQLDVVGIQQNQQVVANQQFAQSHSDFVTAVGQSNPVTGNFMYSAELQKIIMEKPHLRASCNTAQGAYNIVMEQRELSRLSTAAAANEEHQAQQNVDTKLSPMSPAAAGGGGVRSTKGQINESSTAEDVRAMEARVKAGEFDT